MASILVDLQDAIVQFVRQRVQADKWKDIKTRGDILREMTDDDLDELKDHFWTELLYAVRWSDVLDDVEILATQHQEEEPETSDEDDEE
jgi:hypothetical protein